MLSSSARFAAVAAATILFACTGPRVGDAELADARTLDDHDAHDDVRDSQEAPSDSNDASDSSATRAVDDSHAAIEVGDAGDAGDVGEAGDSGIPLIDAREAGPLSPLGCPTGRGPDMARIDIAASTSGAAWSYCIDTTEVTVEDYDRFLVDPSKPFEAPLPQCDAESKRIRQAPVTDSAQQHKPANVGITWCYAAAYCAWAGKRLCGRIGGGAVDSSAVNESEWSYACANGSSATVYPYGDSYEADSCNTAGTDWAEPAVDVGSKSKCHGKSAPFDRLFDMSGNASEYEDTTSAHGGAPSTIGRGGWAGGDTHGAGSDTKTCTSTWPAAIDNSGYVLQGIRCCATAR